jgi:DNA-binding transcriptional LysR family regulator
MKRGELDDLVAYATIARTRSFTRAAAELGLSPSALSHTMRGLETRLGCGCWRVRHEVSPQHRPVRGCCGLSSPPWRR